MKGIVFNLLEHVVLQEHGEAAWEDLLEAAGLVGAYTSLGSYDDQELERLLAAAGEALGNDRDAMLRWFGRAAMPTLSLRFPNFFEPHVSGRTFVLGLNSIVHAEVRKLYPGAGCPEFDIREDGRAVLMGYRSPRRMCALAHGFLEGLADHYAERVVVDHLECALHHDDRCLIRAEWPDASLPGADSVWTKQALPA